MTVQYKAQFEVLLKVLPWVAKESVFALKGGTTINLFHRDLPRLSVDIDLVYLPIKDRRESLAEISESKNRIAASIKHAFPGISTKNNSSGKDYFTRLYIELGNTRIKVETSPVTRGVVNNTENRVSSKSVSKKYKQIEIQVVSFEDMYAGKLNAAMDRQHPRDLFDVKILYENEGLTDDLFRTFLVYVASSPRPMHEILNPNLVDIDSSFAHEFNGMSFIPVSLEELLNVRKRLIRDIQSRIDKNIIRFLVDLHDGIPNFNNINKPQAMKLPAVRWKLFNLEKLKRNNPTKHAEQRYALEQLL